jgi:hypothetical protein
MQPPSQNRENTSRETGNTKDPVHHASFMPSPTLSAEQPPVHSRL